jgi:CubicO group peptidase (beta-lactamase class C family)
MQFSFKKLLIAAVTGLLLFLVSLLVISALAYSPEYVLRVLQWRESDVGDYLNNFPNQTLVAPSNKFYFDLALDHEGISEQFERIFGVADFEALLQETNTQAFIVIQNDQILYEEYFNDTSRETLATSFSVAKSFASALVGIAIDEGYIDSVNEPITNYLPELVERDARFSRVTIRHLLLMASGLDYEANRIWLFNGDDPLTTYYPDQRKAALEFTNIVDGPEEYFSYNKYHPQLLGLILERSTGISVTDYLQEKIWTPVGMEFDGSWSLDSDWSNFEKMEAGINARPIDFAKFGRLFLRKGEWNGVRLISKDWIERSTQADLSIQNNDYYKDEFGQYILNDRNGYYKYMWYGMFREEGHPDISAEGDRGQYIFVSPQSNIIIVRNGFEFGNTPIDWMDGFFQFATEAINLEE